MEAAVHATSRFICPCAAHPAPGRTRLERTVHQSEDLPSEKEWGEGWPRTGSISTTTTHTTTHPHPDKGSLPSPGQQNTASPGPSTKRGPAHRGRAREHLGHTVRWGGRGTVDPSGKGWEATAHSPLWAGFPTPSVISDLPVGHSQGVGLEARWTLLPPGSHSAPAPARLPPRSPAAPYSSSCGCGSRLSFRPWSHDSPTLATFCFCFPL